MATMQDVARRAGVSLSTVSYALSGSRPVSEATKRRIAEAMADLDFRPNAMARGLASRRSHTLALTLPAAQQGLGGTLAEFVASAAATAREAGYHLVLWPLGSGDAEEVSDLARQGLADGVLLMEVGLTDPRVAALRAAEVPFTAIGRTADLSDLVHVDVDFEATTAEAVAHLVELGHRRIGFLNHSQASFDRGYGAAHKARQGFRDAMAARGLTPLDVLCEESPLAGREAMAGMLAAEPGLTALVTMNEIATFGALAALADAGLRVPQDFSVLGIVTSPGIGQMSHPVLSTMHAPGAELGRLAVRALLDLLAGRPVHAGTLVTCRFEPGGSTGPAPH